ncbi:hypothetical protein MK489_13950 [Myxococcota bacterium]|nr:hypothetical protein [Myxococcota bacterium]
MNESDREAMKGSSRMPFLVSLGFGLLLAVAIVQSYLAKPEFVSAHPFNVAWIFLSILLTCSWVAINREAVGATDVARGVGFGIASCLFAFFLQQIVNGDVFRRVAGNDPDFGGYFLLGLGAAVCQVFGKWAALLLVLRRSQGRARHDIISMGLGVGLGFAMAEIVVIGQGLIARSAALTPPALLSLMERFSAGGFHVYSGAAIAIAIATRRIRWIVGILMLHTVADGLAGAQGHVMHQSQLILEFVFLILTGVSWWLYDRARRTLREPEPLPRPTLAEG